MAPPARWSPATTGEPPGNAVDVDVLTLGGLDFNVAADEPLSFTVRLPDTVVATDLNELADHQLRVTIHAPLGDRTDLWAAAEGDLPRALDTVSVTLDPLEPHPALTAVDGQYVTLTLPRETVRDLPEGLSFAATGVLPVVVDLRRDGRTIESLTTFVQALRTGASTYGPAMQVAVVMAQRAEPVVDPRVVAGTSDSITTDAAAVAEMLDVATVLEAFTTAQGGTGGAPRPTVRLEPETLRAIVQVERDVADRLVAALAGAEVVAAPRLPFDASLAAAANRDDDLVRLLREGETLLGTVLPATPLDRTVAPIGEAPTQLGASLLRDLGTRLFVLPYAAYDELPGSLRFYTDTTQLIDLDLGDGTTVPAAVTDERLAGLLAAADGDPVGTAMRVIAELVIIADGIERSGGLVDRHGMVLATPDLGVPDPAVVEQLAPMLMSTPGLRWTAARELASTVDVMLVDGRQVTVGLPAATAETDAQVAALATRTAELDQVSDETFAVASMLPDSTTAVGEWVSIVQSLGSSVFTDDDVEAAISHLRGEFDRVRACVVAPEAFGFTLTGRNSTMRFGVTNTCTMPITVAVMLDSAKIEFPDGPQSVTLPPGGDTTVEVRARARSNGMSSVFLRLYSPADAIAGIDQDTATITPQVVLTARVTSFSGLGQLLGGAGLLLLLTWWVRHVRTARRRRLADAVPRHHPSAGPAGDTRPAPADAAERTSLPGS